MDPITLGALGLIGAIAAGDLGLTIKKKRPVQTTVVKKDFDCPFCGNLVTGDNAFDKTLHLMCIDDAEAAVRHIEEQAQRDREVAIVQEQERTKRTEMNLAAQEVERERAHKEKLAALADKEKQRAEERAEKARLAELNKGKYTVQVDTGYGERVPKYRTHCNTRWRVYDWNHQLVDGGWAPDATRAKKDAALAIRNHKKGKAPMGSLVGTYVLSADVAVKEE